jgi:hypothetical protein
MSMSFMSPPIPYWHENHDPNLQMSRYDIVQDDNESFGPSSSRSLPDTTRRSTPASEFPLTPEAGEDYGMDQFRRLDGTVSINCDEKYDPDFDMFIKVEPE